jgi:hypothetical protein
VYDFLNPDALHVKINDFTMRLKFDTTNPVILTRRGELYLLKGDLIHAENDFQAALSNTKVTTWNVIYTIPYSIAS